MVDLGRLDLGNRNVVSTDHFNDVVATATGDNADPRHASINTIRVAPDTSGMFTTAISQDKLDELVRKTLYKNIQEMIGQSGFYYDEPTQSFTVKWFDRPDQTIPLRQSQYAYGIGVTWPDSGMVIGREDYKIPVDPIERVFTDQESEECRRELDMFFSDT